jgi:hypothetical protein
MIGSEERGTTGFPPDRGEKKDSGRSAPIDADVEGELNAALPEPREEDTERSQESR